MRPSFLIALFTLLPTLTHADYCADRSATALTELAQALGSTPQGETETRARKVLEQLCRDAQGTAPTGDPGTAPAGAAEAKDGESTRLFGIEIKEAPEGAAGYERARKGP